MTKPVLAAAITAAAAALALPAAASAHVTVNPRAVEAGSFTVLDVRVPNERDDKGTNKVDVRFPDDFYFLSYKKVRGWKTKVTREKLDQPVDLGGFEVDDQVTRVVWKGDRRKGGLIGPGQFEEFRISVRVPDGEAGSYLTFKAHQRYRGGEMVKWAGAPDSAQPAPRVQLLAPATTSHRVAGA